MTQKAKRNRLVWRRLCERVSWDGNAVKSLKSRDAEPNWVLHCWRPQGFITAVPTLSLTFQLNGGVHSLTDARTSWPNRLYCGVVTAFPHLSSGLWDNNFIQSNRNDCQRCDYSPPRVLWTKYMKYIFTERPQAEVIQPSVIITAATNCDTWFIDQFNNHLVDKIMRKSYIFSLNSASCSCWFQKHTH